MAILHGKQGLLCYVIKVWENKTVTSPTIVDIQVIKVLSNEKKEDTRSIAYFYGVSTIARVNGP